MISISHLSSSILDHHDPQSTIQLRLQLSTLEGLKRVLTQSNNSQQVLVMSCIQLQHIIREFKGLLFINQYDSFKHGHITDWLATLYLEIADHFYRLYIFIDSKNTLPKVVTAKIKKLVSTCLCVAMIYIKPNAAHMILKTLLPALHFMCTANEIERNIIPSLPLAIPENFSEICSILLEMLYLRTEVHWKAHPSAPHLDTSRCLLVCLPPIFNMLVQCLKRALIEENFEIVKVGLETLNEIFFIQGEPKCYKISTQGSTTLKKPSIYNLPSWYYSYFNDENLHQSLHNLLNYLSKETQKDYKQASRLRKKILFSIQIESKVYILDSPNPHFASTHRKRVVRKIRECLKNCVFESASQLQYYYGFAEKVAESWPDLMIELRTEVHTADSNKLAHAKKLELLGDLLSFCQRTFPLLPPPSSSQISPANCWYIIFNTIIQCRDVAQKLDISSAVEPKLREFIESVEIVLMNLQNVNRLMGAFDNNSYDIEAGLKINLQQYFLACSAFKVTPFRSIALLNFHSPVENSYRLWLYLCGFAMHIPDFQEIIGWRCWETLQKALVIEDPSAVFFIRKLIEQIFEKTSRAQPCCLLWSRLKLNFHETFPQFLLFIMNSLLTHLNGRNFCIIKKVCKFTESVYYNLSSLVETSYTTFEGAFIVKYSQLTTTSLKEIAFIKDRLSFSYSMGYLVKTFKDDSKALAYYKLIQLRMDRHPTFQELLFYLTDLIGIITPIADLPYFKIVIEIAIDDLTYIFNSIEANFRNTAFTNRQFQSIFCRLAKILSNKGEYYRNKYNHSTLQVRIYDFLSPNVKLLLACEDGLIKGMIDTLIDLAMLNPTQYLMPLPFAKMKQSDYSRVNDVYFENICRVEDIDAMIPLTLNNSAYFEFWWEQVIMRLKVLPPDTFRRGLMHQSLSKNFNRLLLGRLAFNVANYDSRYWQTDGFKNIEDYTAYFDQKFDPSMLISPK